MNLFNINVKLAADAGAAPRGVWVVLLLRKSVTMSSSNISAEVD